MSKKLCLLASAFALIVSVTSCDKNEWDGVTSKVTVETTFASADIDASDNSNVAIKFTDVNTQDVTSGKFDASGKSTISVIPGVYNVVVESDVVGSDSTAVRYCAAAENVTIKNENETVKIQIKAFPAVANNDGFIISEYFFNGETNSGFMMHPDQYIVIHNSSLITKYADGLCFATTAQGGWSQPEPFLSGVINDKVALRAFFTIPGDGKTYPVKPGEEIIIATTAADHSAINTTITTVDRETGDTTEHQVSYEYAANLTGADFEWYEQDPKRKDTDNPAVPNLIVTMGAANVVGTSMMHPRGPWSAVLFQLEDGDTATINEFHKANTTIYKYPNSTDKGEKPVEGKEINLTTIANAKVLDAICTADRPLVTRPFAESLDRGIFTVSGCHRQELARRKVVKVDGVKYFKDTNDTSADFEKVFGQYHAPANWRENGGRTQVTYIGNAK